MAKILSSVPLLNTTDKIISIGTYNFPSNTTIANAPQVEGALCAIQASEGSVYLSFAVPEEEGTVVVTFEDQLQQEYWEDSKPHITPIVEGNEGILFGGHPRPRPPKVVS